MTPPSRKDDDTQSRTRTRPQDYESYYPNLGERVTILEQKHKLQVEAIRNEMENMETAMKERISDLASTNAKLSETARKLEMQVSNLETRSGLIATIAAIVVAAGAFLLDALRK